MTAALEAIFKGNFPGLERVEVRLAPASSRRRLSAGQEFIVVVVMANDGNNEVDATADPVDPVASVANFVENNLVEALVEQDLCSEENPCEVTSPVAPARLMEVIDYVECSMEMGESLIDASIVAPDTVNDFWYGCKIKCEDDPDCLAISYFFNTLVCKRYRTPCYWHKSNQQTSISLNYGGESNLYIPPTTMSSIAPETTTPETTSTTTATVSVENSTTAATPPPKEVTQRAATTEQTTEQATSTTALFFVAARVRRDGVKPGEDAVPVEWYIVAVIVGLIVAAFFVAMFMIFRHSQSKSERENSMFQVHKHTEDTA